MRHFCQEFAESLSKLGQGKTLADFGAGLGLYVEYIQDKGVSCVGYDGTPGIEAETCGLVMQADLASPQLLAKADIVFSIEVGEHIPESDCSVFVDNLCNHAREMVVISWAVRGQRGKGHINCLDPMEVVALFDERRWTIDEDATNRLRRDLPSPFNMKALIFVPR